jgi:two-component system response regulator DesR
VIDPELAVTALGTGPNPLTERERIVLRAASSGATIADLAQTLHLSEGTVRNYLSSAIQKLGARNRMEAANIAEQKGWL